MNRNLRNIAVKLLVSAGAALTAAPMSAEMAERAAPESEPVDVNQRALEDGGTARELFQTEADERIARELRDLLTQDPEIQAKDLRVAVQGGIVRLEGRVDSNSARKLAGGHAGAVAGVQGVLNLLRVTPDVEHDASGSAAPTGNLSE